MKTTVVSLITIVFLLSPSYGLSQSKKGKSKILKVGEVEKLAGDFKFTEGPAADAKGNVYFTDLRQHLILIWTVDNKLDTFRTESGRTNGLYFDKQGNLAACEGDPGRISLTSPDGTISIAADTYEGKRFNQPNDVWIHPNGGMYFTDPKYGSDVKNLDQDGMHVYYINPDRSSVVRVCDDFEKPNGVIGTSNGKTLYVTDAQASKTYQYSINPDGTLSNKTLFVEVGCDGMTVDKKGNVYMTPRGKHSVDIYSASGNFIESIEVPERPSNVCFGGKNGKQLYITARTSIYRVAMTTKGVN